MCKCSNSYYLQLNVVGDSCSLVGALQLQLDTSWGADVLSLRYSYTCKVYCMQTILNLYVIFSIIEFHIHAAVQFSRSTVTVGAESVDGPTPAVRMTWSTAVPPECVTSVRVDFRTVSSGPVVATYTTTNTSQTEVIQTGLQCATNYHITVVVTSATSGGSTISRLVQVFAGSNWCA